MKSFLLAGIIVAVSMTIWTDPVLVAIERYGQTRIGNFGGALPGIVVDNGNDNVTLTVLDTIGSLRFMDAANSVAACTVDVQWLCENHTEVVAVEPSNVSIWSLPGAKYCVARCRANNTTYAFVAVLGD